MQLVDTHCHIHSLDYKLDSEEVYQRALKSGVGKIICVGTSQADSERAINFAIGHDNAWAAIGVHPHEAKNGTQGLKRLACQEKVVAIGEIGLDYFYSHSSRSQQTSALEKQIQLALEVGLPIIFHVREAFDDFWPILANFTAIRGVLHSFTDSLQTAEKAFSRGLVIGVNGISTFTKDEKQRQMYKNLPLDKIILETDAPYLTPTPNRGRVNEPVYVRRVAEYLAQLKSISIEEIAAATTHNAGVLFRI